MSVFIHTPKESARLMADVLLALLPWLFLRLWEFPRLWGGLASALLGWLAVSWILACVRRPFQLRDALLSPLTRPDLAALLTALLLLLALPPFLSFPLYLLGYFFAIFISREAFGGLGYNLFNPALSAVVFLSLLAPSALSYPTLDSGSAATPLLKLMPNLSFSTLPPEEHPYVRLGLLLLGGGWLVFRRCIDLRLCLGFVGGVLLGVLAEYFYQPRGDAAFWLSHLFLYGAFLPAALFYITDPVSAPASRLGRIVFACLAGGLALLFRFHSRITDPISYAILLSNFLVPLLDYFSFKRSRT